MADAKISQLPVATSSAGTDVLPIVQSSTTKQLAIQNLVPQNLKSNATTGVLQVIGPAAGTTRVMTVPNADFTAARTDVGQTFTGAQIVWGSVSVYSKTSSDSGVCPFFISKTDNNSATNNIFIRFLINDGNVASGQINANGTGQAAFGSYSDARLKENIVDLSPQLEKICALKPVEFDYKTGGHQIGFIAQNLQLVYPDVVGCDENGVLHTTGWSKTEARLVKALQELNAKFEAYVAAHP